MLLDAFNICFLLDFSSVTLDTGEKKWKKTPASQAAPIIEKLIFI